MSDADQYLERAKQLACEAHRKLNPQRWIDVEPGDYYVVWFCKTLGNWKALISTDTKDGLYWEVTHNGAKQETYVDTYSKIRNVAVKDGEK